MKCLKIFCLATLISLLWHTTVTLIFKLGTDFSQKTVFEVFVISIIVLTILEKRKQKSKNFSAPSQNLAKKKHTDLSKNSLQDNTLSEMPSHLKKYIEGDGYFTLWKGEPIDIHFRIEGDKKGKNYKFYRWAVSPKNYEKIFCIDENEQYCIIDEYEINTKITYKNQRFDDIESVMQKILGFYKYYEQIDDIKTEYMSYLSNKKYAVE